MAIFLGTRTNRSLATKEQRSSHAMPPTFFMNDSFPTMWAWSTEDGESIGRGAIYIRETDKSGRH
jgi:hypothetical protein